MHKYTMFLPRARDYIWSKLGPHQTQHLLPLSHRSHIALNIAIARVALPAKPLGLTSEAQSEARP